MRTTIVALLAVCGAGVLGAQDAPVRVPPHKLVRFKVEPDPAATVLWRVTPRQDVDRATTAPHVLEFTAPPGTYSVERLTIKAVPGAAPQVDEAFYTVLIEKCCEKVPPAPAPKESDADPKPKPKAKPWEALGRIQFGNSGCTATVVSPRRADGKWDVLTAEHCVDAVPIGARGQMQLRGQAARFGVVLVNRDAKSDVAWLVTESGALGDLPFAELAARTPAVGTKIWHGGFGVDVPGNREDGEVLAAPNTDGQVQYALSVSSGDSGGGIFNDATGELLSPVCCTTRKNEKARVWGGSPERAAQLRPKATAGGEDVDDWFKPTAIPERKTGAAQGERDWWQPVRIPERFAQGERDWWAPRAMPERGPAVIDLTPGRK